MRSSLLKSVFSAAMSDQPAVARLRKTKAEVFLIIDFPDRYDESNSGRDKGYEDTVRWYSICDIGHRQVLHFAHAHGHNVEACHARALDKKTHITGGGGAEHGLLNRSVRCRGKRDGSSGLIDRFQKLNFVLHI